MDSVGRRHCLRSLPGARRQRRSAVLLLSRATDGIDDHFDLGQALGGMLLLGIAGTLPEIAITVSAALSGHLDLAVGNLLGRGVAMQTLVLVILDATSRNRRPLSNLSDSLEPLHEAALVIGVVGIAVMGTRLAPSATMSPISPPSLAIVVVWLLGIFALNRNRRSPRWQSADALATADAGSRSRHPPEGFGWPIPTDRRNAPDVRNSFCSDARARASCWSRAATRSRMTSASTAPFSGRRSWPRSPRCRRSAPDSPRFAWARSASRWETSSGATPSR